MKIHEYQARKSCANGVPVPRGYPAFSVREAEEAAQKLGGPVWVVKAQIHAGGRGKGGGVKLAAPSTTSSSWPADPGHAAGHAPDRPEGQKVRRLLHRGRRRHQEGILRLGA
jgi:succinyl-CoA synthetase beta subunit